MLVFPCNSLTPLFRYLLRLASSQNNGILFMNGVKKGKQIICRPRVKSTTFCDINITWEVVLNKLDDLNTFSELFSKIWRKILKLLMTHALVEAIIILINWIYLLWKILWFQLVGFNECWWGQNAIVTILRCK